MKTASVISIVLLILLYFACGYVVYIFIWPGKPILNPYEMSFIIIVFGIMFVISLILYFINSNPTSVNISFFKLFGTAFDFKGRDQKIDKILKKGKKGETEEITFKNNK